MYNVTVLNDTDMYTKMVELINFKLCVFYCNIKIPSTPPLCPSKPNRHSMVSCSRGHGTTLVKTH